MRTFIIKKYGDIVRGKPVIKMSDSQIIAIYNKIQNPSSKKKEIEGQVSLL